MLWRAQCQAAATTREMPRNFCHLSPSCDLPDRRRLPALCGVLSSHHRPTSEDVWRKLTSQHQHLYSTEIRIPSKTGFCRLLHWTIHLGRVRRSLLTGSKTAWMSWWQSQPANEWKKATINSGQYRRYYSRQQRRQVERAQANDIQVRSASVLHCALVFVEFGGP